MTERPFTILSIFAHPDDEVGVGSTLACYADRGVRTVLVCATRGEAATIYCDDCATRDTLAEVRTRELECACRHIGIAELHWLDWPDGGIRELPRHAAVGQVVRLIREIKPEVILTHPENGLYPHPDHLAVWEIVREAFTAAADAEFYPEAGPVWAPARLFTRAIPQSIFTRAPDLANFRVQLNGQQLPFVGTPDDQIDVIMQVAPWIERRMAAWECHKSQHNPRGFFTTMPDGLRREMAEHETFVLAAARVPLPEGSNDDLLAGLTPQEEEPTPVSADLSALTVALASHRAYLDLCSKYEQQATEPGVRDLLRDLGESHREAVYLLARALRRSDVVTSEVTADPTISRPGGRLRNRADQLQFLLAAARKLTLTYRQQAASAVGAEAALWGELAALVHAMERRMMDFLGSDVA